MKVLSVVLGRGGSRGLKNKCITRIRNKMLIEYSVEYSLSLGSDVKTVISTDIEKVIEFCKARGIEHIKRDPKFCRDDSRIDDALADAIMRKGDNLEYCSVLYANIPMRYPWLFRKGLDFLEKHREYDAAISMQNVEKFNPLWMFDYNDSVLPEKPGGYYGRQALPRKVIHDGHTLVFRCGKFLKKYKGLIPYNKNVMYSIFGDVIKPLINDEIIVDIDTEKDLKIAEAVLEHKK